MIGADLKRVIFRGLKFPPNNEIGENSHFWMDTNYHFRFDSAPTIHYIEPTSYLQTSAIIDTIASKQDFF